MSRNIFGPVPSRRLGLSLGVDVVPSKTCTFNCIYCQAGETTRKTIRRREYFSTRSVLSQFDDVRRSARAFDFITFSGNGEPTLARNIGGIIRGLKKRSSKPIAVITNGSLLYREEVRRDISLADVVMPSLDAASEEVFKRINEPASGLKLDRIIDGLVEFRKMFRGRIWLEVMFVKGVNDSSREIARIREVLADIAPDQIDLNTVVRPPRRIDAKPVSGGALKEIARKFSEIAPVTIIAATGRKAPRRTPSDLRGELVALLSRRSCTLDDIVKALGLERKVAQLALHRLGAEERISVEEFDGRTYFKIAGE